MEKSPTTDNAELRAISRYVDRYAPVLFLILDAGGTIERMNAFAGQVMGDHCIGERFQSVIIDYHQSFSLEAACKSPESAYLLNIETQAGPTQSYHFHFFKSDAAVFVFAHLDVEEIESLSNELVAANQELNNLTRKLNKKNRELRDANATIVELTRTDPLTKLANRRHFETRIRELVSVARRKSQPLSLIMTDIDHFKAVNDNYGHDAGDRVISGYSDLMMQGVRLEDLVARFGGEEFILLLPASRIDQAWEVAERLRTELSAADLIGNGVFVTASFGVSALKAGESIEDFIKRADKALYQAKQQGRNQTVKAV
ncbi:MAG: GGDEF domain-containing protein [Desulfosalsimonadaceae bacterium]